MKNKKGSVISIIIIVVATAVVSSVATFLVVVSLKPSAQTSPSFQSASSFNPTIKSCLEGESCTNMLTDGKGGWKNPDGMTCAWRDVCPDSPMQGCCKQN
jgi:flagellar basal body-associated protein FliL